ncbi:MAG TPA: VOC family protein [Microlunatus sp.]|jgi:hypothetical protein|nr:VOC family protein [Microlunatus sp.]
MEVLTSADGTPIALDQTGSGPPLVLVSGAMCGRRADQTMDGQRWLTVHAASAPELPIMLVVPGPPLVEEPIAAQLRTLVAGYLSIGALRTDDCRRTYAELKAKGVEMTEEPEERFYGIDAGFRDPFGNHWRLTEPRNLAEIRSVTSTDGD